MRYFTENTLKLETASGPKSWTVQELLEMPDRIKDPAFQEALNKTIKLIQLHDSLLART